MFGIEVRDQGSVLKIMDSGSKFRIEVEKLGIRGQDSGFSTKNSGFGIRNQCGKFEIRGRNSGLSLKRDRDSECRPLLMGKSETFSPLISLQFRDVFISVFKIFQNILDWEKLGIKFLQVNDVHLKIILRVSTL